jgi:hypothetical protein
MRGSPTQQVTVVHGAGTSGESRSTVQGHVQPKLGFFDDSAPVYVGDVVEIDDPRGGIERRGVAKVEIYAGHHMEVTWGPPPAIKARGIGAGSSGREKWRSRELPILEAVAAIEDRGDPYASFDEVVDGSGLDEDLVRQGLQALYDAGYVTGEIPDLRLDQVRGLFRLEEIRLLEDARVATGQWPSADSYDALLALLSERITKAPASERKSLVALRDAILAVGQKGATEVILDTYRRIRDGG